MITIVLKNGGVQAKAHGEAVRGRHESVWEGHARENCRVELSDSTTLRGLGAQTALVLAYYAAGLHIFHELT